MQRTFCAPQSDELAKDLLIATASFTTIALDQAEIYAWGSWLTGAAQSAPSAGLEDTLNTLSQFDIPLGWVVLPQTAFGWFLKIIGLLLTTLAISLGAPFWFDFLRKILKFNPRSSGPAPAASDAPAIVSQ